MTFLWFLCVAACSTLVCRANTSSKWNFEKIAKIISDWRVPSHFEFFLYADNFSLKGPFAKRDRIQTVGTLSLNKSDYNPILRDFFRKNRFLLIFHLLTNTESIEESFNEIILELELHQKSGRATGTRHHFLLWPNASETHDLICAKVGPYLGSITLQTNIYILKLPNLFLELFSIKGQRFCQGPLFPPEKQHTRFQEITARLPRRQNFAGVPIIATAVVDKTTEYEAVYVEVNGKIVSASGYAVNIFKDLELVLQFTGEYLRGSWVEMDNDGQPTGLSVTQLRSGVADIYITQTTLAKHRAIGFNYIQPTFQDGVYAFVQQPPSSSVHDVHISPFQNELWIVVFTIWTILAMALFTLAYVRSGITRRPFRSPPFSKVDQLQESFMWSIGAACNQGWYAFPKCDYSRLVIFTGSLTGAIVLIMYSGSIISSLTSETAPIQSFNDLLKSSLDIYVDSSSNSIRNILQDLRKRLPRNRKFLTPDENVSFRNVIDRPSASLVFARNFYRTATTLNISNNKICERVTKFPVLKLPLLNGMLLPAASPFRETFNYNIIELKERGLANRYLTHFSWNFPSCAEKKVVYRDNLGIQDVFTAFALLGVGLAISLVIFVVEKWTNLRQPIIRRSSTIMMNLKNRFH